MRAVVAVAALAIGVATLNTAYADTHGTCSAPVLLRDAHSSATSTSSTLEGWTQLLRCAEVEKHSEDSLATATYNSTMSTIGYDQFIAKVDAQTYAAVPEHAAAAMGYIEGTLTAQSISDHLYNQIANAGFLGTDGNVNLTVVGGLFDWQIKHETWLIQMLAQPPKGEEELWRTTELLYTQLAGMGKALDESGVDIFGMSGWRAAMMANLVAEWDDIESAIETEARPNWRNMTISAYAEAVAARDHCSAFVSLGQYNEELYFGHNMWWGFQMLAPVYKTYVWGDESTVQMSSYAGALSSMDDFYSMSNSEQQLAVMETTNNVYNTSLYDLLTPKSLYTWSRAMVANRLSTSGKQWVDLFAIHNSGTYNNMWMVVDYKKFTPQTAVEQESGLLWVAEQMPGLVEAHDESERLSYGSFYSYNQAYFPKTRAYSGAVDNDLFWRETYSVWSQSYQTNSRAYLFRTYGALASTLEGAQKLIRWNRWESDPLAKNMDDAYTQNTLAVNGGLASRGDLNPYDTSSGYGGPMNSVATNGMILSKHMIEEGAVRMVGGPTWDNQPPFRWSSAPEEIASVPHRGHNDQWQFEWQTFRLRNERAN
mmetsp:Transcript_16414/g.43008  ORF Transcript_16414/g.43008 Transcript_16414/m.43008 type:complete len:595 (+) Transcript_16414:122-1906(+)